MTYIRMWIAIAYHCCLPCQGNSIMVVTVCARKLSLSCASECKHTKLLRKWERERENIESFSIRNEIRVLRNHFMGFDFHDDGTLTRARSVLCFRVFLLRFSYYRPTFFSVVLVAISACDIIHFIFEWINSSFGIYTSHQWFGHWFVKQLSCILCATWAHLNWVLFSIETCHHILSVYHTCAYASMVDATILKRNTSKKKSHRIVMECEWGSVSWCVAN